MKKIFSFIIVVSLSISAVGCSSISSSSKSSKSVNQGSKLATQDAEITNVIKDKVKAMNDRKLADYMELFDSKSAIYNEVKSDKALYFDKYQVKSSILNSTVLNKSANKAQIQVEENDEKVKGPGFLTNKTLYIDYLNKIDGKWKITNEVVSKTEYQDPIYDVLYKNIKAANDKKIDDYMDTFDPTDDDFYSNVKNSMLDTFNKYSVEYTLESADINQSKKSGNDTQVNFTETYMDTKDSGYTNTRVTGVYHFRVVNGDWKIYKVDTKKSIKIDQNGNEIKSKSK
ncbi:hypothetical protein [Clostridium hydrogenum]|uniref:hypothetical protein n=1 Tax=Clostridium hydrogenum TaxID=2855764 RepID=UPI001F2EC1F1|nr:hypothetical protein [Clostridium hydrogenum]